MLGAPGLPLFRRPVSTRAGGYKVASVDGLGNITPTAGIVSLAEAKTHLRYPAAQIQGPSPDDGNMLGFIFAATEVIESEIGNVVQRQVLEYHDGGGIAVYLREKPVLRVVSVTENWGYANYDLTGQPPNLVPSNNLWAYSLDNPSEGRITRRTVGNVAIPFMNMGRMFPNNIAVTYITGRQGTPWAARMACLELIAHWWRNSQQRTSAASSPASGQYGEFGTTAEAYNAGVPYAILEILRPLRRTPIIG